VSTALKRFDMIHDVARTATAGFASGWAWVSVHEGRACCMTTLCSSGRRYADAQDCHDDDFDHNLDGAFDFCPPRSLGGCNLAACRQRHCLTSGGGAASLRLVDANKRGEGCIKLTKLLRCAVAFFLELLHDFLTDSCCGFNRERV
jgi:hypothetical protein